MSVKHSTPLTKREDNIINISVISQVVKVNCNPEIKGGINMSSDIVLVSVANINMKTIVSITLGLVQLNFEGFKYYPAASKSSGLERSPSTSGVSSSHLAHSMSMWDSK